MTFPLTSPKQWDSVWAALHTTGSSSTGWYLEMNFSEKKNDFCVCPAEGPGRSQRPRGAARSGWRARSGRHRCESQFRLSSVMNFSDVGQSCGPVGLWVNQLSEQWSSSGFNLFYFTLEIKRSSHYSTLTTFTFIVRSDVLLSDELT